MRKLRNGLRTWREKKSVNRQGTPLNKMMWKVGSMALPFLKRVQDKPSTQNG